jgi:hypothetical protein
MSTVSSPPETEAGAPPDEGFWKKYSPHYEFPLANIASIAVHVVVVVGISLMIGNLWRPRVSKRRQCL